MLFYFSARNMDCIFKFFNKHELYPVHSDIGVRILMGMQCRK